MTLVVCSFLVAAISFLCYHHTPTTWPDLWRRYFHPDTKHIAPDSTGERATNEKPRDVAESREDIDRKAMPPPSLTRPPISPPKPTSPQLTPKASASKPAATSPEIPSFTLDEPSVPSFPALNSAQRASGGRTVPPPRLNPLPNFQSTRTTNATASLMSPPPRGPLPNRTPASSSLSSTSPPSSSLTPPPTHTSIPSKPRKKVLLTPGHSPLDWARLTKDPQANLRGLPPSTPFLRVTPSLLKQYSGRRTKNKDGSGGYTTQEAWTALSGKVYNITPYLPYHPGGEPELLKAAGRDGTRLFGEVHPWVSWEGMLEGCLVGFMVEEGEEGGGDDGKLEEMD